MARTQESSSIPVLPGYLLGQQRTTELSRSIGNASPTPMDDLGPVTTLLQYAYEMRIDGIVEWQMHWRPGQQPRTSRTTTPKSAAWSPPTLCTSLSRTSRMVYEYGRTIVRRPLGVPDYYETKQRPRQSRTRRTNATWLSGTVGHLTHGSSENRPSARGLLSNERCLRLRLGPAPCPEPRVNVGPAGAPTRFRLIPSGSRSDSGCTRLGSSGIFRIVRRIRRPGRPVLVVDPRPSPTTPVQRVRDV